MRASFDVNVEEDFCKSEADLDDLLHQDHLQLHLPGPEERVHQISTTKPHLHGLRGLASLVVYIGHHVSWWYGPGSPLEHGFGYHGEKMFGTFPFIRTFFTGGSAAVSIFFVLSGYVLSISTLQKLHEGRDRRETYRGLLSAFIRRPFRLFVPLAGVSLTFALIMHLPFGLAPHLEWPEPEPTIWKELWKWSGEFVRMMNPLKRHGIDVGWFPYDPAAWTMPAEYKGSLAVFMLLGVFGLAPARYQTYLFGVTSVILLLIRDWVVACFLFGVVIANNDLKDPDQNSFRRRFSPRTRMTIHIIIFFLAWWIICQPTDPNPELSYSTPGWYYMTKIIPRNYYNYEHWRFWNSIGAGLLVYSISNLTWIQSFFNRRALQFLGKISFQLYLIHVPFIWTVGDRICRLLGSVRQESKMSYDGKFKIPDVGPRGISTGFLVSQMIIFPLNVLVALLAYKLLDQPGISIGRWIVDRVGLSKARHFDKVDVVERGGRLTAEYMALNELESQER